MFMKHSITARNKSYFSLCFISFCQILGFPVAFEVRGGHVIEGNSLREFIRIIFMKYKGDIYKDTLPFFFAPFHLLLTLEVIISSCNHEERLTNKLRMQEQIDEGDSQLLMRLSGCWTGLESADLQFSYVVILVNIIQVTISWILPLPSQWNSVQES